MSKMTISVPDELKARMEQIQNINWSGVAQRAFEIEVKVNTKGDNMEMVIERLRATKEQEIARDRPVWVQDGKDWAMKDATFYELKGIGQINLDRFDPDMDETSVGLAKSLAKILFNDDDTQSRRQLAETLTGNENERLTTRFLLAWIEGVQSVWVDVRDKV